MLGITALAVQRSEQIPLYRPWLVTLSCWGILAACPAGALHAHGVRQAHGGGSCSRPHAG